MKKKIIITTLLILLIVFLAACSSTTQSNSTTSTQTAAGFDPSNMTIEQKLAIGTLKLEGTDLAVTKDEAATLLPLWKAVKSLSSSDTAAPEEIQALYQQIQETMTKEQVQEITNMSLTQDDISTLMQSLGIQGFPGGGQNPDMANLSEDERATRIAGFQAQNPGGTQGGAPGGFPGDAAGGPPSGGVPNFAPPDAGTAGQLGQTGQPGLVIGTQTAGTNTNRRSLGMSSMFIEPLINMLTERADS